MLHERGLKNITVNMHPQVPGGGRGTLRKQKVKAKNSERKGRGEGLGGSGKHSQRRENPERLKHVRALQRAQILLAGLGPTCDFKFPSAA